MNIACIRDQGFNILRHFFEQKRAHIQSITLGEGGGLKELIRTSTRQAKIRIISNQSPIFQTSSAKLRLQKNMFPFWECSQHWIGPSKKHNQFQTL